MKFIFALFLLLTSLFFSVSAGEQEWKLKKQKSGIEIYTRSVGGSSFDEFKAITIINNTSLNEVVDVILDVDNYINLFPDCIGAKVLEQNGKYYDIHYFCVKAPWPVKNRDAVYESTTTFSENQKFARIELKPIGNYIKEKTDCVRMYGGTGFWELEERNGNSVKIKYQFHGDPGGKVPAWLANSSVVSSPFQTLINLKEEVKK